MSEWLFRKINQVFPFSMDKEEEEEELNLKQKKKIKKRQSKDLHSLNGRDIPLDLATKADFKIQNLSKAEYSVDAKKQYLTVNFPKQGSRQKRKDYVMEFYELDQLLELIKEEMRVDAFETMNHRRLAAEYPFYFWNAMFHCLGKVQVLDNIMREHGIETEEGKRRKK